MADTWSQQEQGEAAERMLHDRVTRAALAAIEERIFRAWKEAKTPEEREDLWRQYRALDDFNYMLNQFMRNGKLAR